MAEPIDGNAPNRPPYTLSVNLSMCKSSQSVFALLNSTAYEAAKNEWCQNKNVNQ